MLPTVEVHHRHIYEMRYMRPNLFVAILLHRQHQAILRQLGKLSALFIETFPVRTTSQISDRAGKGFFQCLEMLVLYSPEPSEWLCNARSGNSIGS